MCLSTNHKKNCISREVHMEVNSVGLITLITPNCYDILGYTDTEIIDSNINQYMDYNVADLITATNFQAEFLRKDGTKTYFDILTSPITDNDKVVGVELSFFDISKYMDTEKKYKSFLKMIERAQDIVFRYELQPKPRFTYVSPSATNIFGISTDEFYRNPMSPFELAHPDDYDIQQSKVSKNADFTKTFCTRVRHKNGSYIWIEDYIIPTFDDNGELVAIEGISRNIQERKELEEKLEKLSYQDGLTGLYNRTYLNKQIQVLSETGNVAVATIVCDLDNLKYINDSLGHSEGDKLLKNVATFFNTIFSENSLMFRNGGDEFIIITPDISLKEAEAMYSKMLLSIEKHNETNEMPIQLSSGFAYSSSSKNLLEQINRADKNMYKNKCEKKQGIRC